LSVLETLGWAPFFDAEFEPYKHDGFIPARVAAQHRGEYALLAEMGELRAETTGALRHAALTPGDLPAVGDWVAASPNGERAVIQAVLPRQTAFVRKAAGERTDEQVLAANVDVAFLIAALDGDLNPRRLERYLAGAWESGAKPVVVLTKRDLCHDVEASVAVAESAAIGVPVHALSATTGEGLDELEPYFAGNRTAALLGSSGVGKSTLVNSLSGRDLLPTAAVRADGRGRHTTTHRQLVLLPSGGLILDTPGLRELQLWDSSDGLAETFDDIEALTLRCRFADCGHDTEPGCAVGEALRNGWLAPERLRSYRKLQRELRALALRADPLGRAQEMRKWKIRARSRHRAAQRPR
jgi:ribosome biogenesis GTPase / thiamine phosphate phosphatase